MSQPAYKRAMLKLGGESLAGPGELGIDPNATREVAHKIKALRDLGVDVAVVLGGGNIWRGRDANAHSMDRSTADHIGMLATVMNALALRGALERAGVDTRVQTAIEMRAMAEPYIRLRAIRHLEKGRVVIFGAGTGNPYFTTDTGAALRAMEIGADVFIKATKVDAVYTQDPKLHPDAERFTHLSYIEALNLRVGVMDNTALTLCMDNQMPIIILDLWEPDTLQRAAMGEQVGTLIQ
jgi:uridylate kinase